MIAIWRGQYAQAEAHLRECPGSYQVGRAGSSATRPRVIAANMAGQNRVYAGAMPMNVIEAVDLQAASFGDWMGPEASEGEATNGHYRRYIWDGDRLSGAVIIGPARQLAGENDMGMLKGLSRSGCLLAPGNCSCLRVRLKVKKAFLATRHVARLLPHTLLDTPSQPLETVLSGAPR